MAGLRHMKKLYRKKFAILVFGSILCIWIWASFYLFSGSRSRWSERHSGMHGNRHPNHNRNGVPSDIVVRPKKLKHTKNEIMETISEDKESIDPNKLLGPRISIVIPVVGIVDETNVWEMGRFFASRATSAPFNIADAHYDVKEIIMVAVLPYYENIFKTKRRSAPSPMIRVIPLKNNGDNRDYKSMYYWSNAVNIGISESKGDFVVVVGPNIKWKRMKNIHWLRSLVVAIDTDATLMFAQPTFGQDITNHDLAVIDNAGVGLGFTGCKTKSRGFSFAEKYTSNPECLVTVKKWKGNTVKDLVFNRISIVRDILLDPACFAMRYSVAMELKGMRPSNIPFLSLSDMVLRASLLFAKGSYQPTGGILTDLIYKWDENSLTSVSIPIGDGGKPNTQATPEEIEFGASWSSTLTRWLKRNCEPSLKDSTLVWDSYCGCTGWALETINFVTELEHKLSVEMVADDACICKGLTPGRRDAVDRMRRKRFDENVTVFVSHKPPQSYPRFPYEGTISVLKRPKYVIGRSMSETTAIPSGWVQNIEEKVDEIWVPTKFHLNVFATAGVPASKIFVIPLPFDVELFNPAITPPLPIVFEMLEKEMKKRSQVVNANKIFKFLSIFKFEERKGWDILLEAYFTEFDVNENVALVLHTYMFKDWANQRRVQAVRDKIATFADSLGLKKSENHHDTEEEVIPITVKHSSEKETIKSTKKSKVLERSHYYNTDYELRRRRRLLRLDYSVFSDEDDGEGWESQSDREQTDNGAIDIEKAESVKKTVRVTDSEPKPITVETSRESYTRFKQKKRDTEEILAEFPPVVVITDEIDQKLMPGLHKACDAFVLPTRGEGWGMPVMEAMAMELPVIVTNFSGPTEYLSKYNSYPLPIVKEVPCTDSDVGIGNWAQPSLLDLRKLMRHVFKNKYEAEGRGKYARADVVRKFSKEKVAEIVLKRLKEIIANL